MSLLSIFWFSIPTQLAALSFLSVFSSITSVDAEIFL